METIIVYWGSIGIMEKKMETIIVCWGSIGIMEKKMQTTIFKITKAQALNRNTAFEGTQ